MKYVAWLLAVTMLLGPAACTKKTSKSGGVSAAKEKSMAPDITVTALDGKRLNLSELKGKVVLLNFWATWCPPCREEIPSLMKLDSAMAGKPFQMLAVSIDEGGVPAIEAFYKSSGYKLPTYTDPDGLAVKAYGITGVPETFLIDKNGLLVKKIVGGMAWDSPDAIGFIEGLMK